VAKERLSPKAKEREVAPSKRALPSRHAWPLAPFKWGPSPWEPSPCPREGREQERREERKGRVGKRRGKEKEGTGWPLVTKLTMMTVLRHSGLNG